MAAIVPTILTLAAVTAAATRAVAAANIAEGYNGFVCTVNIAKPSDHVEDIARIVLSAPVAGAAAGVEVDLLATLVYKLWVIQGKPAAATPITQDHINKFAPEAHLMLAKMTIYKLASLAGIAVDIRLSDVAIRNAVPAVAAKTRAVNEMVTIMVTSGEEKARIATAGRRSLQCLLCNAIHREQNEGHNWFTDEAAKARSPTGKALTVAGAEIDALRVFMAARGHDEFHHLEDRPLEHIATAIAGSGAATLPDIDIDYAGNNVRGSPLRAVFYIGEAAIGRFPAGILGKAAIMICCQMTNGMINHIMAKVLVGGAGGLTTVVNTVSRAIAAATFTHAQLLAIDASLADIVALTYGYCTEAGLIAEDDYPAYQNHAKRAVGAVASGKALAQSVMAAIPNKAAVEGGIIANLGTIATAFNAVAALSIGGAAIAPGVPVIDTTAITAETGEDQSSKLINAMLEGRLGAGGNAAGNGGAAGPAAASP